MKEEKCFSSILHKTLAVNTSFAVTNEYIINISLSFKIIKLFYLCIFNNITVAAKPKNTKYRIKYFIKLPYIIVTVSTKTTSKLQLLLQ